MPIRKLRLDPLEEMEDSLWREPGSEGDEP